MVGDRHFSGCRGLNLCLLQHVGLASNIDEKGQTLLVVVLSRKVSKWMMGTKNKYVGLVSAASALFIQARSVGNEAKRPSSRKHAPNGTRRCARHPNCLPLWASLHKRNCFKNLNIRGRLTRFKSNLWMPGLRICDDARFRTAFFVSNDYKMWWDGWQCLWHVHVVFQMND